MQTKELRTRSDTWDQSLCLCLALATSRVLFLRPPLCLEVQITGGCHESDTELIETPLQSCQVWHVPCIHNAISARIAEPVFRGIAQAVDSMNDLFNKSCTLLQQGIHYRHLGQAT